MSNSTTLLDSSSHAPSECSAPIKPAQAAVGIPQLPATDADEVDLHRLAAAVQGVVGPLAEAAKHKETQQTERHRLSLESISRPAVWGRAGVLVVIAAIAGIALFRGQDNLVSGIVGYLLCYLPQLGREGRGSGQS
jgi:hypothetical protein